MKAFYDSLQLHPNIRHGHSRRGARTRTYRIWKAMRMRVFGRIDPHNYMNRGITIDPRWNDFCNFLSDMGAAPDGMSIDRIDNDGPYSPENCRWATAAQQARNNRRNRWIEFDGKRLALNDAVKLIGVTGSAVTNRVTRLGVSYQEAFDALAAKPLKVQRAENGRFA